MADNLLIHAQDENAVRQLLNKATNGNDHFFYTNYYDENGTAKNYVQLIDSIANTTGVASHFCKVYIKTMTGIASQIEEMDSIAKSFIKRFEMRFADYFLKACFDDKNGNLAETSEWNCYFSSKDVRPWQLVLLGVNAHINIDFWQALTDNFSEKEIRQNKKQMLACRSSVAKVYSGLFDTMVTESGYLKFINAFTKGFAAELGKRIMFKWRRRNINLAILFYHNHEKFKRKWVSINKKKYKNDKNILQKRSSNVFYDGLTLGN